MKTKEALGLVLVAVMMLAMLLIGPAAQVQADDLAILKFGSMAGVPRPYTGAVNAIRGIPGGGLPWVIAGAEGKVTASGKLTVEVSGLVIDPSDPVAISRGVAGSNPSATFRAIVSCLSKDGAGNPSTVNITTDAFPATTGPATAGGGNAEFTTFISLPKPCIAPIIFVTSPAGSWFASTGN